MLLMKCDNKEVVYMDYLDSSRKYLLYHLKHWGCYSVTFLDGTPVFDWCVLR